MEMHVNHVVWNMILNIIHDRSCANSSDEVV